MLDLITKDPHITYAQLEYETEYHRGQLISFCTKSFVSGSCVPDGSSFFELTAKISRIDFCKIMLNRFANGSSRAVSEILTGDETWIYHYDPETKRMSKEWVEEDAPPPTKVRRARSVGKQIKTVTADWYTTVCLPKVITAIESQREKTGIRRILLHHDNASSHTAARTREFLENSGLKTLPHPPYSPDLAPCDFWLFPRLKEQLRGRRFSTNEELRGALFQAIGDIPKEEWKECFDNWFTRMKNV
ncbi:Histone-lysine N-methyltransferase SETMAR-like [Oopsacas minuta]|uniref:Histone-lysine N-methyltransferase SETMAR-like n=1 Tax=Oopsacas minuta TaxID=111878 RepID=A0AAV7JRK8_9METZ|nr:Histone-lysine N-methyltransferase SETMAR-like [Oopsacas minuta]